MPLFQAFLGLDVVVARVLLGVVADVVEDEELGLGAEVGGVGDAGRLEIGLGLARDVARVARIVGAGDRIGDVADHGERGLLGEGIHHRGVGVGDDQHVAVVDRLPAANRRPVESQSLIERRFVLEFADRRGEMLPLPQQVHELQIHERGALVLDHLENLFGSHRTRNPPGRLRGGNPVFPVKLNTARVSCRGNDRKIFGHRRTSERPGNPGAAASHALCHENSPNATPVPHPH